MNKYIIFLVALIMLFSTLSCTISQDEAEEIALQTFQKTVRAKPALFFQNLIASGVNLLFFSGYLLG